MSAIHIATLARQVARSESVSRHSGLRKWEWLPGMADTAGLRCVEVDDGRPVKWFTREGSIVSEDDILADDPANPVPDLADTATVHALHALVVRSWTGHRVTLHTGGQSSSRLFVHDYASGSTIFITSGGLAEVLGRALLEAPVVA